MLKNFHQSRGSTLLVMLPLMIALMSIAYTLVIISNSYQQSCQNLTKDIQGKYVAQAGLADAVAFLNFYGEMSELQGNVEYPESVIIKTASGWGQITDDGAGGGKRWEKQIKNSHAEHVFGNRNKSLSQRPSKDYKVILQPASNGYTAYAHGVFEKHSVLLKAYIGKRIASHPSGIFASKELNCRWGGIDAYDSRRGKYGSNNHQENALVGCHDKMVLADNFAILGNVTLGPRNNIDAPGNVRGNIVLEQEPKPLETMDKSWLNQRPQPMLEVLTTEIQSLAYSTLHYEKISLQGVLAIAGETTIYCHGDCILGDDSKVQIASGAKLNLYVAGNLIMKGRLEIADHNASQFHVYGVANDQDIEPVSDARQVLGWSVQIEPQSDFVGVVYAPYANVRWQSSHHYFGSLVGYRVCLARPNTILSTNYYRINNCNIHFDTALLDDATPKYLYFLQFMQRLR